MSRESPPSSIDQKMYDVLVAVVTQIFPQTVEVSSVIKRHVWYDEKYLGIADGKTIRWIGWSVNCRVLKLGYRTIYIDFVPNTLSSDEQENLYGPEYTDLTRSFKHYICLFITGCSPKDASVYNLAGFATRCFAKTLHPCIIEGENTFLDTDIHLWVRKSVIMLNLYRKLNHLIL